MSVYAGGERPPDELAIRDVQRYFPTTVVGACPYGYETIRTPDERGFLRATACRLNPDYKWVQVRVAMEPALTFEWVEVVRGGVRLRVPRVKLIPRSRLEWRLVARAVR